MSNVVHTVNVDEVTPIGAVLRAGRYSARLLTSEGSISKTKPDGKGNNPMIVATFVVTEGEHEGLEAKIWYTLSVSTARGKKFAGGIIDAKKTFAAIGKPLPAGFAFPAINAGDPSIDQAARQRVADTAAQLYAKRLKGVDVELLVVNEGELLDEDKNVRKDSEGNILYRTRTTIIGPARKASAVAATTPATAEEDFDFGDDE